MPSNVIRESLRPIASRLAKHEAGHYVVARVRGFGVTGFYATLLDSRGAYRGGCETTIAHPLTTMPEVDDYLSRRIQVLYAGALAESSNTLGEIDYQAATNCLKTGGAMDDYSKARELLNLVGNVRYPQGSTVSEMQTQLNGFEMNIWQAAAACVQADHLVIQGLARLLTDRLMASDLNMPVSVTASEINALPGIVSRFKPSD
jgi:hypothetical protein